MNPDDPLFKNRQEWVGPFPYRQRRNETWRGLFGGAISVLFFISAGWLIWSALSDFIGQPPGYQIVVGILGVENLGEIFGWGWLDLF